MLLKVIICSLLGLWERPRDSVRERPKAFLGLGIQALVLFPYESWVVVGETDSCKGSFGLYIGSLAS